MSLTLVFARTANGCIGKDGHLPWNIPEDLKHFHECSAGKTVLMGRRTWESIPEKRRPLPGRKNIVISRNPSFQAPGAVIFQSLEEALRALADEEVCVIGGVELFRRCLPLADKIELTEIRAPYDGDTFFPDAIVAPWRETQREDFPNFSFFRYERV